MCIFMHRKGTLQYVLIHRKFRTNHILQWATQAQQSSHAILILFKYTVLTIGDIVLRLKIGKPSPFVNHILFNHVLLYCIINSLCYSILVLQIALIVILMD